MGCLKLPYETEAQGIKNHAFLAGEILGNFCVEPKKCARDYEYRIADHLGNTRVMFTTKPKTHVFTVNYEGLGNDDQALFEDVTTISNDIFDHTDAAGTTYTHAQMLNGTEGSKVGSVIAIPVGMGDTLNAKVYAKYVEVTSNPTNAANTLASALIGAFTGGTGMTNELGNQSINNNFGSGSLIGTTGFPVDGSAPMAFLNVMFLPEDELITLDNTSFAYDQISGTATQPIGQPKNTNYDELSVTDFIAPSQGYVLVYLSNESSTIAEVYFDDLEIEVNEHPVIQKADYYAYGMQHAGGYKRITAKENRFLYNGKELQTDLDLNHYAYGARFYDPAISRFTTLDPKAEIYNNWSSYLYAANNPIRYEDTNGEGPGDKVLGFAAALLDNATGGLTNVRSLAAEYVSSDGAADFNLGQDFGDVSSIVVGLSLIEGGTGAGTVGVVAAPETGGASLVVSAVGVAAAAEGAVLVGTGAGNFASQKGRLNANGKSASDKKLINDAKNNPSNSKVHDTNNGPSGKRKVHTVKHSSRKTAKDAARQGGKGTPVKHTKDAKGGNHYHHGSGKQGKGKGTKGYGSNAGKVSDNVHHEYPKKN